MRVGYDILGNIAVLKFGRDVRASEKKRFALALLKKYKQIRTVLDYGGKLSGRLRTHKTKHLAGEKTKEALYKENGCLFRLNVDTCYFSPRLASERLEIAKKVRKEENVLVIAPHPFYGRPSCLNDKLIKNIGVFDAAGDRAIERRSVPE